MVVTPALFPSAVLLLAALVSARSDRDDDDAAAQRTVIGRSHEGRDLISVRTGHGPLRILLLAGIHGDEREGGDAMPDVLAWLARASEASIATWLVVLDMNPDGAARNDRSNAHGVDLNRNWPAHNFAPARSRGDAPLSEPETRAVHALFASFAPHLVISLHSSARGPFVNLDGPADGLATRFAKAAGGAGAPWRIVRDIGYPTPGSLGSFAGVDRTLPVLTIELLRGGGSVAAELCAGLAGMLDAVL